MKQVQLEEAMNDEREAMMQATFPRERMEHAAKLAELVREGKLEKEMRLIDEYQVKIERCRDRIGLLCREVKK